MNVLAKIQDIIPNRNDREHELLYGGRVVKPGAIRQMTTKCSICGKAFKIEGGRFNYFYAQDATFHLVCPDCYGEYINSWTVVSCEKIEPHGGYMVGGTARGCIMKDGTKRDLTYGNSNSTWGEVPKVFGESLRPYIDKYLEEERMKNCNNVELVDTYDVQKIIATFESGDIYELNFKVVGNVVHYNPNDIKKLTKDQINRINDVLKDRGLYGMFIREMM